MRVREGAADKRAAVEKEQRMVAAGGPDQTFKYTFLYGLVMLLQYIYIYTFLERETWDKLAHFKAAPPLPPAASGKGERQIDQSGPCLSRL